MKPNQYAEMKIILVNLAAVLKSSRVSLLLCFTLLITGPLNAQSDPYTVEVAVADRSDGEQAEAFQLGLRRVLRNNSGDKTVLNRDLVRQKLTAAIDYVKAFNYTTPPAGTVLSTDTLITAKVRQTSQATQIMVISFDREQVNELIRSSAPGRQADAETEERSAPLRTDSALLWLLIEDQGRDILISDPAAVNVQRRAREIAGGAGISLVYPTGDAEDQFALTVDDMRAADPERLAAASVRYGQDMVLLGNLFRRGAQGWSGQWLRLLGSEIQQSSFESASLDEALQDGLKVLSSVAAIDESFQYGGQAVSGVEGLVWVGSVSSTDAYVRLMDFLQSQPSVSTVYPKEITETSILFSVVPRNALSEINAAVAGETWLRRSAPPASISGASPSRNADLALEISR